MNAIWRVLGFSDVCSAPAGGEELSRERRVDEIRALLADIAAAPSPDEAHDERHDAEADFCSA